MKQFKTNYYDGLSSKCHEVDIQVISEKIVFHYNNVNYSFDIKDCIVETPMPNCNFVIELPDQARLEITPANYDIEDLKVFMQSGSKFLHWIESHKTGVLTASVGTVVFLFVLIQYGAPLFSRGVATSVPHHWANQMDKPILKNAEQNYLSKSKMTKEEQARYEKYFQKHSSIPTIVNFRAGDKVGANAFALSGKNIIFTDEIIDHMQNDKYLLAIYLHEEGHLKHRHVLSGIVSAMSLNLLAFFIIGDMPGITESLANFSLTLISLKHSRDFEREADLYAIEKLKKYNLSPKCFSGALKRLGEFNFQKFLIEKNKEELVKDKDQKKEKSETKVVKKEEKTNSHEKFELPDVFNYLSTHPDLEERIKAIESKYESSPSC